VPRAVLSRIGHVADVRDTEYWFEPDIRFVYRQSPQYLVSQNSMHVVIERDPPDDVPGVATVVLDPSGRLVRLRAIPDGRDRQPGGQAPPTVGGTVRRGAAELERVRAECRRHDG
jgi:hypothetical protein